MASAGDNSSLFVTQDGSHSLYSSRFRQHYHNPNGAVAESLHVFFEQMRLPESMREKMDVSVLEIGFGTGLNLLLLADLAEKSGFNGSIRFESLEAWPIHPEKASELNYGRFMAHPGHAGILPEIFENLHNHGKSRIYCGKVEAIIHKTKFSDFSPENRGFTHVFHDPFSPEVNRELWLPEVFKKIKSWSDENAILSTYCAASTARAAMVVAGWFVARAQGALGKREMTVASLSEKRLDGFRRVNEKKLAERWRDGEWTEK